VLWVLKCRCSSITKLQYQLFTVWLVPLLASKKLALLPAQTFLSELLATAAVGLTKTLFTFCVNTLLTQPNLDVAVSVTGYPPEGGVVVYAKTGFLILLVSAALPVPKFQ